MNCPACNREFSFWYSFRIINTWKHRCPDCGVLLTGGTRATITATLGGTLGLAIASVAIVMEEKKLWDMKDSLLWFAFAFPVVAIPIQYWSWKWVRFVERRR